MWLDYLLAHHIAMESSLHVLLRICPQPRITTRRCVSLSV